MATITLVYKIDVGNQDPANLLARLEAIDVDANFEMLQMTKTSDVSAIALPGLTRTIELQTNATSDQMFPTDALKRSATKGLLTNVFAIQMPAQVSADEPVVT